MTCLLWLALTLAIKTTPEAIGYIQMAGGLYLLFLAVSLVRDQGGGSAASCPEAPPFKTLLFRGVITNVTNPKVPIFFFAFIPPFIPVDAADPALYAFGLGCLLGGLINFGFGLSGSLFRGLGTRTTLGRPVANVILAGLFAIIGLSVITFKGV